MKHFNWDEEYKKRNADKQSGYVALQFYNGDMQLIRWSDVFDTYEQALAQAAVFREEWYESIDCAYNPWNCSYSVVKVEKGA